MKNNIRITGGSLKGKKISFDFKSSLRPTSSKLREVLFNWLQFEIKDPNEGRNRHRVGFTVSKKVGNAVVRNRARRRLKSVVNDVLTSSEERPLDLVLIGRVSTLKRSYDELLGDFRFALKSARTRQEKIIGRAKDE